MRIHLNIIILAVMLFTCPMARQQEAVALRMEALRPEARAAPRVDLFRMYGQL